MTTLLVGCGYWGKNWAKTLHRLGALGAVCDPRPEIQATLREQYPGVRLYGELAEALADPDVRAVVIATPVVTHLDVARQALLAGKHVLVEKPLTLSTAESEELVSLAERQGLHLAVGHLLMYHPALLKLQSLIQAGELGEILSVQCTRTNLGKIRNEENVWWSLAPHDLSILSMLLGEAFEPVSASGLCLLNRPELQDTVFASFRTVETGKPASIHVSWYAPAKRHETVVIGTRKIAIFEDVNPADQKLMLMDTLLESDAPYPDPQAQVQAITKGAVSYVPFEMGDELLALEAQAFLEAVRGERATLQNDGRNGLHVVRMLESVQHLLEAQAPSRAAFCGV